jgi:hypothetical protein
MAAAARYGPHPRGTCTVRTVARASRAVPGGPELLVRAGARLLFGLRRACILLLVGVPALRGPVGPAPCAGPSAQRAFCSPCGPRPQRARPPRPATAGPASSARQSGTSRRFPAAAQVHSGAECDARLRAAERREAALARLAARAEARADRLRALVSRIESGRPALRREALRSAAAEPQARGIGPRPMESPGPLAAPVGPGPDRDVGRAAETEGGGDDGAGDAGADARWLEVRVPAGAGAGAGLEVRLPDGSAARIEVPQGAGPGSVVQVPRPAPAVQPSRRRAAVRCRRCPPATKCCGELRRARGGGGR